MITKAGRRAARLIERIDKGWSRAMDRLPDYMRLYHLKEQFQDYAKQHGREAVAADLRRWEDVAEDMITWFLDTPLDVKDVIRKLEEFKLSPEGQEPSECDAYP